MAYLSPEQTGRMNRALDYRTDFYSLGATFYELLTGKVPFDSKDAMEVVHCHNAKTPIPVCDVNPDIPPILSDIVMKLMAKNAEDRYQSAWGHQSRFRGVQYFIGENVKVATFYFGSTRFFGPLSNSRKTVWT